MVIQSVEKQAKVADSVSLGNDMVLNKKTDSPLGGNGVPGGTVASILLEEYLSGFRNTEPLSLFDVSILVQLEGDSTRAGRRSGCLEKKTRIAASRLPSALSIGCQSPSKIGQMK
jgi:hypothetical protein